MEKLLQRVLHGQGVSTHQLIPYSKESHPAAGINTCRSYLSVSFSSLLPLC